MLSWNFISRLLVILWGLLRDQSACHAHLQQELTRVDEEYEQSWAQKLALLLVAANVEREENDGLTLERIEYYEREYSRLVGIGNKKNPSNKERSHERAASFKAIQGNS